MEANIAAWMIGGGRAELEPATARNLRNLWILRAARDLARPATRRDSRIDSLVASVTSSRIVSDPACCPA
jgi:hypothetical protein